RPAQGAEKAVTLPVDASGEEDRRRSVPVLVPLIVVVPLVIVIISGRRPKPRWNGRVVILFPRAARSGGKTPETLDMDGRSRRVLEAAEEITGPGIVGVDPSIPEVPDQKRATERAEAIGRDHHPPRRVEFALGDQVMHEVALEIVDIHEARAGVRDVVVLVGVLGSVRDVEPPMK